MKRILIVKTSALGDITIALNILPHIKALIPDAHIDWVCEKSAMPFVQAHPLINHVIPIETKAWRKSFGYKTIRKALKELRKERYDCLFDLQGNCKSALVTFFARAKIKVGFGKKTAAEWPAILATHKRFNPPQKGVLSDLLTLIYDTFKKPLPQNFLRESVTFEITDEEKEMIDALQISRPTLLVCPQSMWINKRLKRRVLSQFLRMIEDHYNCRFLIAWGSEIERANSEKTAGEVGASADLLPKFSPMGLQTVMSRVSGIITVDSFSLHLASLTERPTFSIFGASLATYYAPKGARHTTYQGECPYQISFEKRCPILRTCKTGSCIKQLDPAELFLAFKQSAAGRALTTALMPQ